MSQVASNNLSPLAEKLRVLLRESRWLLLVAVALYLILVLYGYDRADAAWSHSVSNSISTHNPGGVVGAWLADLLLYVFGFSAWWWVVLMLQRVWASYRKISADSMFAERALWAVALGFVIYFFQVVRWNPCVYIRGKWRCHGTRRHDRCNFGSTLAHLIGYTGATLFLLALMAVSFSLFTGLSWLRFVDRFGEVLETGFLWARNAWQTRQDRRIGEQAVNERFAVVEEEKKAHVDHQPIRIELPVVEVQQSTRVAKEKQVSLFDDIHDSNLPPLHLLDQAKHEVEVLSAETLEYTSRLIERKLNDFGVEVKVVAAYPGPVITRYEIEPAVGVKGSQITNLVRDLARALSVVSIRLVETIPEKVIWHWSCLILNGRWCICPKY